MFASHDSKVVYRSGSILGYPENFRYKEVMKYKVRGQKGRREDGGRGEYCSNAEFAISFCRLSCRGCARGVR